MHMTQVMNGLHLLFVQISLLRDGKVWKKRVNSVGA